jgi:hypothetical protein
MPRLVGKQSNNELLAGLILVVAVGAVAGSAEYYGYTNLIPSWGRDQAPVSSNLKLPTTLTSSVKA